MNGTVMQSKSWISALVLVVKSLARLIVNMTNVANDAVAMAEKSVSAARRRQVIDLTISTRNYEAEAVDVAALQRLKTHMALEDFVKDSPERKQVLAKEQSDLKAVIAAELAKLQAEAAADD